ncbi:MAG: bifunctional folylpolyglutamate synthase/dihydrofolate synthase [Deltaproteobacteria bacterium]|nr:bifunctional folylpolyglutamate synthase/dihydrofolate synthase [Deltaproteobacteria bacterium]MBW2069968.1 bifunctional folylpolyglutamate synthase/dihydrofolate synthase [Deltaproteobacteria bacterium]
MGQTTYQKNLSYLYDLQKYGIKFGLSSTRNLLHRLGNPHEQLKVIHIAGTNGKGSTAAMISAVLHQAGYRVGLYTSPHLVRFNERFRLNEKDVTDQEIMSCFQRVRAVVDDQEPPTFFEMTTAMALSLFAEKGVDWAILEVGMGGRLDATNVLRPQVAVITNVSLEHQEFLGSSLTEIAREKAGIIKEGVPLVTAARQPAVLAVIEQKCQEAEAACYRIGRHIRVRSLPRGGFSYRGLRWRLKPLHIPLAGRHQMVNAATALGALEVLQEQGKVELAPGDIMQGLAKVRWPGRLEWLSRQPQVLLDGAHNPAGMSCLSRSLREQFRYRRLIVVLGVMEDKDVSAMLRYIAPLAAHLIVTKPRYERGARPEAILAAARKFAGRLEVVQEAAPALARAAELADQEDLVLVTGSLYFLGEVKEINERRSFTGNEDQT